VTPLTSTTAPPPSDSAIVEPESTETATPASTTASTYESYKTELSQGTIPTPIPTTPIPAEGIDHPEMPGVIILPGSGVDKNGNGRMVILDPSGYKIVEGYVDGVIRVRIVENPNNGRVTMYTYNEDGTLSWWGDIAQPSVPGPSLVPPAGSPAPVGVPYSTSTTSTGDLTSLSPTTDAGSTTTSTGTT